MLRKRRRSGAGGADAPKRRTGVDSVVKAEGERAGGAAPACELGTDPNVATAKPEQLRPAAPAASDGEGVLNDDEPSPFPKFARPLPEESELATALLAALHGRPNRGPPRQRAVLDSLVRTMLSQNTTDANSSRAFAALKDAFPTWEAVLSAEAGRVEDAIRCGGLAETKARRIRTILQTLKEERGTLSLEHLRAAPNAEVKRALARFSGVGPKTVACVLMFCLQRAEFPVDTHVWRISRKLGWVPKGADRNATYAHMNARVPPHLKYDLHVLLIAHGKSCRECAANGRPQRPLDAPCPLASFKSLGQLRKNARRLVAGLAATKEEPGAVEVAVGADGAVEEAADPADRWVAALEGQGAGRDAESGSESGSESS